MNEETNNDFKFNYTFPINVTDEGVQFGIFPDLPFALFYEWYEVINSGRVKPEDALKLAGFGALFILAKRNEKFSTDDYTQLKAAIEGMLQANFLPASNLKSPEDALVAFSYFLLTEHGLSYNDVAAYASEVLGKPVHPDSWRIRVARWARNRDLPAVDKKRGRPSAEKPSN